MKGNKSVSLASEVKKIGTTTIKGLLLSVLLARSQAQKLQTQDPHLDSKFRNKFTFQDRDFASSPLQRLG